MPTGNAVFLRDIWPSAEEIAAAVAGAVDSAMFKAEYGSVFEGDERWRGPQGSRGRPVPLGGAIVRT